MENGVFRAAPGQASRSENDNQLVRPSFIVRKSCQRWIKHCSEVHSIIDNNKLKIKYTCQWIAVHFTKVNIDTVPSV